MSLLSTELMNQHEAFAKRIWNHVLQNVHPINLSYEEFHNRIMEAIAAFLETEEKANREQDELDEHAPHITIMHGSAGWFAVHVWWNAEDSDLGGFWKPYQSSPFRFATEEEAIEDGRRWAEDEGLPFVYSPEITKEEPSDLHIAQAQRLVESMRVNSNRGNYIFYATANALTEMLAGALKKEGLKDLNNLAAIVDGKDASVLDTPVNSTADFDLHHCGRCYDEVSELYDSGCSEKPEKLGNCTMGQYHCPDCGAVVLAGVEHPKVCELCRDRRHPSYDNSTT